MKSRMAIDVSKMSRNTVDVKHTATGPRRYFSRDSQHLGQSSCTTTNPKKVRRRDTPRSGVPVDHTNFHRGPLGGQHCRVRERQMLLMIRDGSMISSERNFRPGFHRLGAGRLQFASTKDAAGNRAICNVTLGFLSEWPSNRKICMQHASCVDFRHDGGGCCAFGHSLRLGPSSGEELLW